jgi:hypothetical protein
MEKNIYTYLNEIDINNLFMYFSIIIISIFLFSNFKIKGNLIIALFVGILICYILNEKVNSQSSNNKNNLKKKIKEINIKNKNVNNYNDFIDFLFYIKECKEYNYETYKNIVDNIDSFLEIYRNIKLGVKYCKYNYDVAIDKKRNALNSLHSLILNIDSSFLLNEKLNDSIFKLQKIFNIYENEMIQICNDKIDKEGFTIHSNVINNNHKYPYNYFDNKEYTYDLY